MSRIVGANSPADHYAVMGNPVAHSKSPRIHACFARQTGQPMVYDAILVAPGKFQQAVRDFAKGGGKGLNVTIPFKQDAFALSDEKSPRALLAQAVNTLLIQDDGGLVGDNTDGIGLLQDLMDNHGLRLTGQRILLVGAGGAAQGVLGPLLQQQPHRVLVVNRTVSRAVELAARFASHGPVEGCGYNALPGQRFDLIINATATGLRGEVPPLPGDVLEPGGWCYDLAYGPGVQPFLDWALRHGATGAWDGLGMLVEQAAESFALWRGVRPATAPVIAELEATL